MKTNEQIRIKVAELCGYEIREWGIIREGASIGRGTLPVVELLPNYPEDLNACVEFESLIGNQPDFAYEKLLHQITGGRGEKATATQRCEAFLRLKGLWK